MRIRWHGQSCFEIGGENKILVTDPHDGKSIGINPPDVQGDIILVSHDHYDHNAVREVDKQNSEIVREPGKRTFGDIGLKGIASYHDENEGKRRGENTIFKFKIDGTSFCHMGDLGHLLDEEKVKEIGDVDFLFVPIGGNFTIGPKEAKKTIEMIEPKIAVPMHFKIGGLSLDIKTIEPFLSLYPDEKTYKLGVELDFIKADLPDETEIWAFSL
ncbi:MAG: MBL fold metallo-hydrolase [Candidatus Thermoplasmatota archaeon]|nr:MBL fold metallo-hydrolase [Candidatus Thermoplasmatota archaeon]